MLREIYITAMLSTLIVGCASHTTLQKKTKIDSELSVSEDIILGGSLPEWVNKAEVNQAQLYVIGYAEMSAKKSNHYVKKAALMDAEIKILSDAPTDFRVIAQTALTGAGLESSEFYEIQTKIKDVYGVQGVRQHQSICRKVVRHGELIRRIMKACWIRVSIDIAKLQKAYAYTVRMKYGDQKAGRFEKLMADELKQTGGTK